MKKRGGKARISIFLILCIMSTVISFSGGVFAEEIMCENHPEHDDTCGFEGADCIHLCELCEKDSYINRVSDTSEVSGTNEAANKEPAVKIESKYNVSDVAIINNMITNNELEALEDSPNRGVL